MRYKTEQEDFWSGEFGDAYIERNRNNSSIYQKAAVWARMLRCVSNITSAVELGCNIGVNLQTLNAAYPGMQLTGYEINQKAASTAEAICNANIKNQTITETIDDGPFDLAFTSGVLIHINPKHLDMVYRNLCGLTRKYIIISEYYNPKPVSVMYRGHRQKLFKRDFAGELIDNYGCRLVDYGFFYRRDNWTPQDDLTFFLLEKKGSSIS